MPGQVTKTDLEALGAKLDALELTDAERHLLDAVLAEAARDDEVTGYGGVITEERPNPMLTPPSTRLAEIFNPAGKLAREHETVPRRCRPRPRVSQVPCPRRRRFDAGRDTLACHLGAFPSTEPSTSRFPTGYRPTSWHSRCFLSERRRRS